MPFYCLGLCAKTVLTDLEPLSPTGFHAPFAILNCVKCNWNMYLRCNATLYYCMELCNLCCWYSNKLDLTWLDLTWFQRYGFRKVWPKCYLIWQLLGPWASPYGANGQITITVHNYRFRQFHETLNGVNPSSSFRDTPSAKSGPNLWQIWQHFDPWASPYGVNEKMTMTVYNYRPRQFHRTSNGENPSSGYRDMDSAILAAARPPARTVTTIPLQPGGLRGKTVTDRLNHS